MVDPGRIWPPPVDVCPAVQERYGLRDAVIKDRRLRRDDERDQNAITASGTEANSLAFDWATGSE
jgi:hypothetical protein